MYGKLNVGGNERVTVDGEKVKEKINLETFKGDNPLMLESAGYTFPANTLLKDGLEIINSVTREGQFVWKRLTTDGGDFVAFVTADVENAYPDGGMQDGYWYELVKGNPLTELGFNEFKMVDFVPTSSETTITVSHTLGEQPTFVMLVLMDTPTEEVSTWSRIVALYTKSNSTSFVKKYEVLNMRINGSYITSGAMSESSNGTNPTVTADTESVTFKYTNGSIYYPVGLKYRLLVGA